MQRGRISSHNYQAEKLNRLLWTLLGFTGSGVKDYVAMWSHQSRAGNASSRLPGLAPMDRLGGTDVAYMKEASLAGVNRRNISIWTETRS